MTDVMQGVRILEVAEHTFVPAASALLADWGAEVIKIEHVERGDAMRGLASTGVVADMGTDVHALLEHSNRGKKSLGPRPHVAPTGSTILYQLAATLRRVPHQQAAAACARSCTSTSTTSARTTRTSSTCAGTGQGERGPDADKGSYDSLAFWAAPGMAIGRQAPRVRPRRRPARARLRRLDRRHDHRRRDHGRAVPPRAHRRGDDRRRVAARHRPVGDGPGDGAVAAAGHPVDGAARRTSCASTRSSRNYQTKDGRCVSLALPAGRQVLAAAVRGRSAGPSWRPTRASPTTRAACEHSVEAASILREVFARAHRSTSGASALADFIGQWTVVQDTLEAAADPQTVANGYVAGLRDRRRARRSSSSPRRCSSTR